MHKALRAPDSMAASISSNGRLRSSSSRKGALSRSERGEERTILVGHAKGFKAVVGGVGEDTEDVVWPWAWTASATQVFGQVGDFHPPPAVALPIEAVPPPAASLVAEPHGPKLGNPQ